MSDLSVRIRAEQTADHPRVHEVEELAFDRPGEADLVDALRGRVSPEISLVAVCDDAGGERLVGHVYFSPVEVGSARHGAIALGPVAVDPVFQGRGVGSALCRRGLERCREIGQPLVFVLGRPAYYPRFGFEPARARGLYYKDPSFDPAFFVAELTRDAAHGFSGEVSYRPEFDAV